MPNPIYYLKDNGQFVIENYNFSKPFSSFLPGVAGLKGKPLWSFYVNRGQGVCAFGVDNRDQMIMEFLPADQAYQRTSLTSFRTFYKTQFNQQACFYEPFRNQGQPEISQRMIISSAEVSFEEQNSKLGLLTNVTFFTLPGEKFPALMRKVTIKNTAAQAQQMEVLDGLPKLMPYGMNEFFCKNMSRTSEAWMGVQNLEEQQVPFYKLKVIPLDEAKVQTVDKGNFYCVYDENNIIKPIVDPALIFGPNTDFSYPYHFFTDAAFVYPQHQITDNRTPCAFVHYNLNLQPGQTKTFYQIIGQMANLDTLNKALPTIANAAYFEAKQQENLSLVSDLTHNIETVTNSTAFNFYTKQTYLDNVLRGGLPVTLAKDSKKSKVCYIFSRKHGDLERDYNRYSIAPTYYSQGNGNYRDVNQNRRTDLFFNQDLGTQNIKQMLNLIQLDGYNPLIIRGQQYQIKPAKLKKVFANTPNAAKLLDLSLFAQPFTPGELAEQLQQLYTDKLAADAFFTKILLESDDISLAEHGEGYWSDHWHYSLDMLELYLSLYPDKAQDLFLTQTDYTFYDDCYYVLPRKKRYAKNEQGQVRQVKFIEKNPEKQKLLAARKTNPNLVRTKEGKGDIYTTNLTAKIFHLLLIKASSLDPCGVGIEMEGGKPNWYDAINGLPALFGSSSSESFELKRWLQFFITQLQPYAQETVTMFTELHELYTGLLKLITEYTKHADKDYAYWNQANNLKEVFRWKTKLGIQGTEVKVNITDLIVFAQKMLARLDASLAQVKDPVSKVPFTYFKFEAKQFTQDPHTGEIDITKFQKQALPLFLEGPVHYLKLAKTSAEAAQLYQDVKQSPLFDQKLKMYKVNSSLADQPLEIGRNKVFTPGWLENESIWLHMEYKYLWELLKAGLYDEFTQTLNDVMIAFQDPNRYARSILENSSFIASSANPDQTMHGQGFVARLSGSTAEFISIWLEMFFGRQLFTYNQLQLSLTFSPKIPAQFFTQHEQNVSYQLTNQTWVHEQLPAGSVLVNFLKDIPVIFHNPKRANTWEAVITKIRIHPLTGQPYDVPGATIPNAKFIRDKQVNKLEVFY